MALIIRMRQQGAASHQSFRIVVSDAKNPRDGKYLEKLGWYNPFGKENNFQIDVPRVQYWLGLGAEISDRVKMLVKKTAPEVIQELTQKEIQKRVKMREKKKKRAEKAAQKKG